MSSIDGKPPEYYAKYKGVSPSSGNFKALKNFGKHIGLEVLRGLAILSLKFFILEVLNGLIRKL